MEFLKKFKQQIEKLDDVILTNKAPTTWYHTGNYALNRILSGSFTHGIASGRIGVLAGVSGAGKSYTTANVIANAQKAGAFVLALDSENALSDDFVSKIGVQTSPDKWSYVGVSTIETVTAVLSEFITGYEKEYGRDNPDAPKVLIVLDSLDMLISNAESEKFEKGVQTSDMGTRTRLFKHLLRTVVNRIARTNMTMLVTHQVYLNQDVTNGHGEFIVNNAVRYSASQIAVFKPLKLKEGAEIKGIRIKAESYKSRFAQPGIKVEIEVPWETGMDPFSGTLDMLLDMGVITQGGAWYSATIGEETRKFQRKQLDEQLFQWLLTHPKIIEEENRFLSADQVEEQVSED